MRTPPRSNWDRDPQGTYRKMNAEIDKEIKNGYLTPSEVRLLRNAANKCYLKSRRNYHNG